MPEFDIQARQKLYMSFNNKRQDFLSIVHHHGASTTKFMFAVQCSYNIPDECTTIQAFNEFTAYHDGFLSPEWIITADERYPTNNG